MQAASKSIPSEVVGIGLVLDCAGQVLIDKRLKESHLGGMWEFPGGKQKKDEAIELTIAREIKEEMRVEVEVGEHLISFDHVYRFKKILFVVHICKLISGDPRPLKSQEVRWVHLQDLLNYSFPSANSQIIDALMNYLSEDKFSKFS